MIVMMMMMTVLMLKVQLRCEGKVVPCWDNLCARSYTIMGATFAYINGLANDDDDDDGLPTYSHHDKIPPLWESVSNDKGGNVSVSKFHHT